MPHLFWTMISFLHYIVPSNLSKFMDVSILAMRERWTALVAGVLLIEGSVIRLVSLQGVTVVPIPQIPKFQ